MHNLHCKIKREVRLSNRAKLGPQLRYQEGANHARAPPSLEAPKCNATTCTCIGMLPGPTWHPRFLLDCRDCRILCLQCESRAFRPHGPVCDSVQHQVYLRTHAAVHGPCIGTIARSSRDTRIYWTQLSQPERLWKGELMPFPIALPSSCSAHHMALNCMLLELRLQAPSRALCVTESIPFQAEQSLSWLPLAGAHNAQ